MIEIDLSSLRTRIGEEVATSDWLEITQARIDQFAATTEDRQWIHVDPHRAATESPFRTIIAHGFLTLSLVSVMLRTAMQYRVRMAINYGLNRVRFVAPVPVGSRIRGRFSPAAVEEAGDWLLDDPPAAEWFDEAIDLQWTRDPFDRLLVAHARLRGWRLATGDSALVERLGPRYALAL